MNALTVFTSEIRLHDGLFSLNDLHQSSGGASKHKPANFMRLDTTQELMAEIRCSDVSIIPAKTITGRGKAQGTYVCKELVYAYAMWISPKFHLTVIRAFDDMQSQGPTPSMLNKRWLITLDDQGREHVKLIPYGAVVMTPVDFLKAIANGTAGHSVTDGDLLEFIQAASTRLKTRADARAFNSRSQRS